MYLIYEEYAGMGGGVPENAFPRLEAKARGHLDRITFGRLMNAEAIPEAVKYCMFDLINAVEAEESNGAIAAGREIASMSNDGVSVAFSTTSKASSRYTAIARQWLATETDAHGTPLLYAGVVVR